MPWKPRRVHVAEERGWLQPLVLGTGGAGRRLAYTLHAWLRWILRILTDPEVWLERMFDDQAFAERATLGQGDTNWRPVNDGLYRAASSLQRLEPWNRERLRLQLGRSLLAERGSRLAAASPEAAELLADEDCELLGSGLCAPRLDAASTSVPGEFGLRVRSHVKSKRSQLFVSQLYELRLDLTRVTVLRAACGETGVGRRFEALDSREGRAAAELQELYHRYQQELDADLTSQLDSRLDALAEHGRELRRAWEEEDAGEAEVRAQGDAREAYRRHLEERRKLRARRDEREQHLELLCRGLYGKWRELQQIRKDQGFISTPWKLQAQPEDSDPVADADRRTRNINAELEETVGLQGGEPQRVRMNLEHRWDLCKRAPGAASYRFEVFLGESVTSTEALRSRAREEQDDALWEEVRRRWLVSQVRVRVVCRVGERIIGSSPTFPLHWETWSTASLTALEAGGAMNSASAAAHGAHAPPPLHSFDLAVHIMPRNLSLLVEVAVRDRWQPFLRWHPTSEVEVGIPGLDGRRVTHAAVLDQLLTFGPPIAAGAPGSDIPGIGDGESCFSGELTVCVSWPGAGRMGGFVVPPSRLPGAFGSTEDGPMQSASAELSRRASRAASACLTCRSTPGSPRSPRSAAQRQPTQQKLAERVDERLAGLRFDPQDPENARMLMESPAPKALPGYDVSRLGLESCRLRLRGVENVTGIQKLKRVQRLLHRAEREGVELDRVLVPSFDREVHGEEDEEDMAGKPDGLSLGQRVREGQFGFETEHRREFLRRVRARVRKVSSIKTHISYKSIVREHGQDVVEGEPSTLPEKVEKILASFQIRRPLRPKGGRRRHQATARSLRVHVSLAKVYNALIRCEDPWEGEDLRYGRPGRAAAAAYVGPFGAGTAGRLHGGPHSFGGQATWPGSSMLSDGSAASGVGAAPRSLAHEGFGVGMGGTHGGFGTATVGGAAHLRGMTSPSIESTTSCTTIFGASEHGLPSGVLPEVVVEMALSDLDGVLLRRRTTRVASSTDPDVNQILELPLRAGSKEELSPESLSNYGGGVSLTIFDEVTFPEPERGGEMRTRLQRRQLGRFLLPWNTLYAAKCSVKGHFRVEQPLVTFGYRRRPNASRRPPETDHRPLGTSLPAVAEGSAEGAARRLEPEPMYVSFDVTVDPALAPPQRVQSRIVKGGEPSVLLKHVQKWLDLFKTQKERKIMAFGTDMDGHSRLICRFIRPQRPPEHIDPADPFAIEAAAKYVSMVPFLSDREMFPQLTDLWCTDQEFLNIQCGDWEEHAILLCNYFNYIDRFRRENVDGYGDVVIHSYCVLCDVLPEGEVWMVLRRDPKTGHCEFWQAVTGDCYFRAHREPQRWRPCPSRSHKRGPTAEVELRATPMIPIQRVHMAFDSDNVWANMQGSGPKASTTGITRLSLDLNNARHWRPLFVRGREDLQRLSGAAGPWRTSAPARAPVPAQGAEEGDTGGDHVPEDPSQVLRYEPADAKHAGYIESKLESQLEQKMREHRALGEHSGVQQATRFNRVIALRLGDLLDELERLSMCRRKTGSEACFPLRSHAVPPVSLESVELKMQDVERDFRIVGRNGRGVFGVPFNQPYTDFSPIWEAVRDARILELGDESSEYAVKIRVYPYACGILSVWVFVACSMGA